MPVVNIPISITGTHNLGTLAPLTGAGFSDYTMLVDGGEIPVGATINSVNIGLNAGSFDPGSEIIAFSRFLDADGVVSPSALHAVQGNAYGHNEYLNITYQFEHASINPDTSNPWTRAELYLYKWGWSIWAFNSNTIFSRTTEEARVNGMTAIVDYSVTVPPEIRGSLCCGDQGTVHVSRAVLFSLNGSPNTNNTSGLFKIAGDMEVTGNLAASTSERLDGLGT